MNEELIINLETTIKSALKTMARTGEKCLIVVNNNGGQIFSRLPYANNINEFKKTSTRPQSAKE